MSGVKRDCVCPRARHVHGTVKAYNQDACRCVDCSTVRARYVKRQRWQYARREAAGIPVGLVDSAGTRRRLQALAAIGWSTTRLATELGVAQQRVSELQAHTARVQAQLAARVSRLYDRLWNVALAWPGAAACRVYAAGKGYVPPLAWDDDTIDDPAAEPVGSLLAAAALDEVAVTEAMRGRPVPLNRAERAEAVRRLTAAGYSSRQIAERLSTYQRKITRDRAKGRAA